MGTYETSTATVLRVLCFFCKSEATIGRFFSAFRCLPQHRGSNAFALTDTPQGAPSRFGTIHTYPTEAPERSLFAIQAFEEASKKSDVNSWIPGIYFF